MAKSVKKKKKTPVKVAKKAPAKAAKKAAVKSTKTCSWLGTVKTYHRIPKPNNRNSDWPATISELPTVIPAGCAHAGYHAGDPCEYYVIPANFNFPPAGGPSPMSDPPPKIR